MADESPTLVGHGDGALKDVIEKSPSCVPYAREGRRLGQEHENEQKMKWTP